METEYRKLINRNRERETDEPDKKKKKRRAIVLEVHVPRHKVKKIDLQ